MKSLSSLSRRSANLPACQDCLLVNLICFLPPQREPDLLYYFFITALKCRKSGKRGWHSLVVTRPPSSHANDSLGIHSAIPSNFTQYARQVMMVRVFNFFGPVCGLCEMRSLGRSRGGHCFIYHCRGVQSQFNPWQGLKLEG